MHYAEQTILFLEDVPWGKFAMFRSGKYTVLPEHFEHASSGNFSFCSVTEMSEAIKIKILFELPFVKRIYIEYWVTYIGYSVSTNQLLKDIDAQSYHKSPADSF